MTTNNAAPDLATYDVILVNSSAGKDSQAMLDYVVDLATVAGVRDRLVLVHADLGRVEWKGTRELAEEHAKHYGIRFEVVSRPQGDLLDHVESRGRWPSSQQRYCTSDHKRDQVAKIVTKLVTERRSDRAVRVLNCLGLRADESPARAKKDAFVNDKRLSNKHRHVDTWLPIHGWTIDQVWARNKQAGTKHHPAYDLGMPRLSCCFCIFAPKAALMIAGRANPELLDQYVAVEDKIGHRFRESLSIREVKEAIEAGEEVKEVTTWNM